MKTFAAILVLSLSFPAFSEIPPCEGYVCKFGISVDDSKSIYGIGKSRTEAKKKALEACDRNKECDKALDHGCSKYRRNSLSIYSKADSCRDLDGSLKEIMRE